MMEKNMETTIKGYIGVMYTDISPIMENEEENNMEHEVETGGI